MMVRWLFSIAFSILSLNIQSATSACPSTTVQLDAFENNATTFTSEDYPNGYPSLQACSWLITASGAARVLIFIPELGLERNYDILYIYDGNSSSSPSLWVGTGSHTYKFFISTSDTMYVQFFSDYSVSSTGFKIQAMAVDRDDSAVSYNCGDTLTASSSIYSHLSVVLIYDSNHRYACSYTITSSAGTNIQFSLPIDKRGGLILYDGTNSSVSSIVSYTGSGDTSTYQSSDNNIFIQKTTPYAEFVLVYQEVSTAVTVPTAGTTTTTVAPVYACSSSYLEATTAVDVLESPGYPNPYSNNLYCLTTIEASDPTESVTVSIMDVELLSCCDILKIFDGYSIDFPLVWNSDENDTNVEITSTGAAITVLFYSDGIGALRGFQLEYWQVSREIPSCVPTNVTYLNATTSQQSFSSPNYPSNYDNADSTYWLLTKTDSDVNIVLDIHDIKVEYSIDCVYDRLTIYDGPCTTSPVLAEICGSNDAVIEDSTGLYILVEFVTDSSVTEKGWEILYYMGEYVEEEEERYFAWWVLVYSIPAAVIWLFVMVILCCLYYKRKKAERHRIIPSGKGKLIIVGGQAPAATKAPKRLTTSQLLSELQMRYGERDANKKKKVSWKHQEAYGTGGGPHRHPGPARPPPYGGTTGDPAYPPNFFKIAANEGMTGAPTPNVVPTSQLPPPSAPTALPEPGSSIPGPSRYVTPAEARQGATISRPKNVQTKVQAAK